MSDSFVTCGTLRGGLGFSPIVCFPATGELVLADDANGNCVISNISVVDPIEMDDDALNKLIAQSPKEGCVGVAVTCTRLVLFYEFSADVYEYTDLTKPAYTVAYDTDVAFEGTINF